MSQTQTHSLTVAGPNLGRALESKGTFHVHAAGCADLKRGALKHAEKFDIEVASLTELCDGIYPPDDFQCESGEYLGEFHVLPCCASLPLEN